MSSEPSSYLESYNYNRRERPLFSSSQLEELKKEFHQNRYICQHRRIELASNLDLDEHQVKTWFQNKRSEYKKRQNNKPSSSVEDRPSTSPKGLSNQDPKMCFRRKCTGHVSLGRLHTDGPSKQVYLIPREIMTRRPKCSSSIRSLKSAIKGPQNAGELHSYAPSSYAPYRSTSTNKAPHTRPSVVYRYPAKESLQPKSNTLPSLASVGYVPNSAGLKLTYDNRRYASSSDYNPLPSGLDMYPKTSEGQGFSTGPPPQPAPTHEDNGIDPYYSYITPFDPTESLLSSSSDEYSAFDIF